MACGSCAERQKAREEAAVSGVASQTRAKFSVIEPSGHVEPFDDYTKAVIHKRKTNGQLTTST